MKNIFVIVIFVMAVFMTNGCGSVELTPEGEMAKLMKSDPPGNCKEVGSVVGSSNNMFTASEEKAKIELRNNAGKLGANYVRMETAETPRGGGPRISGTAFKCPEK